MTYRTNLKIIAFVGLAGSGKSTAVEYFTERNFPRVYFGGVILDAMTEAGLEHTQENERPFRKEFREKHGNDAVVNVIIEQISRLADAGQRNIIVDGLYAWTEYKILKKAFKSDLKLVATVAPRRMRYHRLSQRPIRPLTRTEAYDRDTSEIEELEKGGPIAIADYYIVNNGSIENYNEQLDALAKELELL